MPNLRLCRVRVLTVARSAQFSSEPNNLMASNSYKYSSANSKAVGIDEAEDAGCVYSAKSKVTPEHQPAGSMNEITLAGDFKAVAKTISSLTSKSRPDLTKVALARWYAINRAQVRLLAAARAGSLLRCKRINSWAWLT
jgi:hypothetical protein